MGCSVLSGSKYSIGQIQQLLLQAGWPDIIVTDDDGDPVPLIVLMSAISISESSGYSGAHNQCGENSVGLLQINRDSHPELSADQLSDPVTNLQKAYSIYLNEGLDAWGPYQTGIYTVNLPAAWSAYSGGAVISTKNVKTVINQIQNTNTNLIQGDTSGGTSGGTQGNSDTLIYMLIGLGALFILNRQ